jgi:hypothetical protein
VLALALLAVAGSLMLPAGDSASAAALPPVESVRELTRYEPAPTPVPGSPLVDRMKPFLTWETKGPILGNFGVTTYRFRLKAHGGPIGAVKVEKETSYSTLPER